jgi:formamidopyrimidine-DNA glycosylase
VPELPDIAVYAQALRRRVTGATLASVRIKSPFLLRSVEPPIDELVGHAVVAVETLGKRLVLCYDHDCFLVIHLMIAGRLHWKPPSARPTGKIDQAALEFLGPVRGTLILTEAGTRRQASLTVIAGREALRAIDPGGIDPLTCTAEAFHAALTRDNRTLKRALTDPHIISGIGNAYSDEVLHAARLSPVSLTRSLTPERSRQLLHAMRDTLTLWTARLMHEFKLDGDGPGRFPGTGDITAFRPDFAVHGRFKSPCPVCGTPVARIVRADNEFNYCPTCQTGGRVLADRSLSRLLKDDWPPAEPS